jgi:tricorn protease
VPQSDEEPVTDGPKPAPAASTAAKKPANVSIDFDGILQRILALPVPEGNYVDLATGENGDVFLSQAPLTQVDDGPAPQAIMRFDLEARKVTTLAEGTAGFSLSFDGKKMLYEKGMQWFIASTAQPTHPGEGMLATSNMEVYVTPREEWQQMYHETWRIERDFFFDKHFGGLDLAQAEKRFEPFLAGLGARNDLSFLFREMISYLSTGHLFVGGGAQPPTGRVTVGLLGADYAIENGRYRFTKIFDGENWNPDLHAPLTQPGARVKVGEYLLSVNGRPLHASDEIYSFFEETAGKQVVLSVGPDPDGKDSRQVTVTPVATEFALRNNAWIEDNRRLVDKLSGGKLAYVYLPDTQYGGFTNFNRYFFAQVEKKGAVIDERFNHGGQVADYIIDYLSRKQPQSELIPRDGKVTLDPALAIYGPKVMLINQYAGSGGDALPWYFRKANIGPLIGVRTWGGLVGIGGTPSLLDGGRVEAPHVLIAGLHGEYEVEGHGIAPDIEVWQDPKLVREGHDPQLEAAIAKALELLEANPQPTYPIPPYPEHHPHLPPATP